MAEPIFDPTTERVYEQLPQHYRDRDVLQNYQFKRYIAGLLSSQNDINTIIDRLTYIPPEMGGDTYSTSDLVNPYKADTGWLKWLGQLFGTSIAGEVTDGTRNEIVQASGFRAGTTDSLIAAVQTVLVGTKKVRIVKHADASWQPTVPSDAGPWNLLVMTLQSETLTNLLPPALSKTLTPSVWSDEYKSLGYDPDNVYREIVEQPDVYQKRAYAYSLRDTNWTASAKIETGFGGGPFGLTTFGISNDRVSDLDLTSRQSFPVTPTDSYQYLVSLGLKQDKLDQKISSIGFKFYDGSNALIKNTNATNYYPDPSSEYSLSLMTGAPSGAGTVSLSTTQTHTGVQSVAITNNAPTVINNTNLAPNPYYTSNTNWAVYATTASSFTLGAGDTYQGRPSLRETCTNLTGANRLGIRTALGVAAAQPNLTEGKTYWFSFDMFVSSDASTPNYQLIFRDDPNNDSGAVTFATGYSATGTATRGQWNRIVTKVTVNAGRTITGIYVVGSNATQTTVGAYMQTTRWMIEQTTLGSTTPTSYFDGDTVAANGYTYSWNGTAGASTSTQNAPGTVVSLYKDSANVATPESLGLSVGDSITASAWVYIPSSITPSTEIMALIGSGVAETTVLTDNLPRDTWIQVAATSTVTDTASGVQIRIYSGTKTNDVIYWDDFGVTPGTDPVDFSGDTPDPADGSVEYIWNGVPGTSTSSMLTDYYATPIDIVPTIENTSIISHNLVTSTKFPNYHATGSNADAINISNFGKYEDGDIIRATVNNVATTSDFGIGISSIDTSVGRLLKLAGMKEIPSGTTFVFSLDFYGDVSATIDGIEVSFIDDANGDNTAADFDFNTPAFVTLTKGRWHTRHWVATVKPNRTVTSVNVTVQSTVNQDQGVYLDTANWMIEEGNVANKYFNGDTPADDLYTYQWDGIPGDSVTNKVLTSVAEANVVDMKQYSTRFTAPASSASAKVFVRMLGFNGRDTLYIAQPATREEPDDTWVPVTADPIQAIKDKGVKPAGVILHWLPIISDWDTITAEGTRDWDDLRLTWTQLEELS